MSSSMYRRSSFSISKPSLYNQTREKEKFELSTLNDKFADYVEKVRYLEAQNKKIQMDTNLLNEKQSENYHRIKTLFETEIAQLKQIAENLFKDKNILFTTSQDNSILQLKQHLNQTFKEYDSSIYETENIERQLSSIEGDILMYKRRLIHQDNEYTQYKQFINHLQRLLLQAKNEIHNEILTRTSYEQTTKQLHIDINRLYEQQQQKLKDLKQSSIVLTSNSTIDRAYIFKSELSNAIKRIRQDFERQNDLHRNELYTQFTQSYEDITQQYPEIEHLFLNEHEQERIKQEEERIRLELQRLSTDSNLLKQKNSELKLHINQLQINLQMNIEENKSIQQIQQNQIDQFKLKHEKITKDYENVITKQITLEKEIETYRNLLEGTMKPVVDNITDEYNSITTNQIKLKQQYSLSNRKTPSKKIDLANTNPYVSSMTLNTNDNQSINSSTLFIDIPIVTNENDLDVTKTIENNQITNVLSSSNIRPPIIIQTQQNN